MRPILRAVLAMCLGALATLPCSAAAEDSSSLGAVEAVSIATEAYIYGYPLVTFDMARKQQTNVAVPDPEHAPMGQMIRMRSYPAVDNHCCAAPNADTLYTIAWLDVSQEPTVFSIPDMGSRYYMMPMLERLVRGDQGRGQHHHRIQGADLCHHRAGLEGHAAARHDAGEVADRHGVDPRAHLQHRHA